MSLFLTACTQNDVNSSHSERLGETKDVYTTENAINNSHIDLKIYDEDKSGDNEKEKYQEDEVYNEESLLIQYEVDSKGKLTGNNATKEIEYLTFQDERLKKTIIHYLKEKGIINKGIREIEKESLDKIKKLDLKVSGVSNLEDLSQFKYLESIDLSNYEFMEEMGFHDDYDENKINDLTPLENLKNIKHLDISYLNKNNKRSLADSQNIEVLSKLTKLEYLDISNNSIQDISFLENMPNLKVLKVNGNDIEDFSVLEKLNNLEIIEMKYNNIKNAGIFIQLEHLKEIKILGNNAIKDYELLNSISDKVKMDVQYDYISDDTIIDINNEKAKEFIKKEADINGEDIRKSDVACITSLDLYSYPIEDISWIRYFTNLVELDLKAHRISDISSLENLDKLQLLDISRNQIKNIDCIKNMKNLTKFRAYQNEIEDISPIIENENIKECDVTDNKILSIDCLLDRTAPIRIDVRWNPYEKNDEAIERAHEIIDNLNEGVYVDIDLP